MQENRKDQSESRFQRLRAENRELREKLAFQKRDVQDNLKAQSTNEALLNAMPAGLIVVQDGKVRKINDTMWEYLGRESMEDLLETDFLELVDPEDRDEVARIHKSWETGRMIPEHYDARLTTIQGSAAFFDIRCKRIRFQNRTAFLLVLNCLKDRMLLERRNHCREKSEALLAMAAGVNDRLGPLNEIILKAISDWKKGDGNPAGLDKLEGASKRAQDIINRLKTIVTIEKNGPFIPCSLNEAIKEAVRSSDKRSRELFEAHGIKTAIGSYPRNSLPIEGDISEIKEAVSCIINNALESMPEGGDVHVTTEDNNGEAHVYIQDSGTGISEALKDRIFDPFFTTKSGATGLGLTLAFSIIKKHGGHLDIESSDGNGTMFHLRFPLSVQKAAIKIRRPRKKIAGAEILIIQDSDITREVFSHILVKKGCKITKSSSARDAFGRMKKKSFDMIVADETALRMNMALFMEGARKIKPGIAVALVTEDNAGTDKGLTGIQKADLLFRRPVDMNAAVRRIVGVLAGRDG